MDPVWLKHAGVIEKLKEYAEKCDFSELVLTAHEHDISPLYPIFREVALGKKTREEACREAKEMLESMKMAGLGRRGVFISKTDDYICVFDTFAQVKSLRPPKDSKIVKLEKEYAGEYLWVKEEHEVKSLSHKVIYEWGEHDRGYWQKVCVHVDDFNKYFKLKL